MKKFCSALVVCISSITTPVIVNAQPQPAQCKHVKFASHPHYPPLHWVENNKMRGATVEITAAILDELGIPWESSYEGPWKRVLKKAENGIIDLIVGFKRTPQREAYLVYTDAHFFTNPVAIFVRANSPIIFHSLESLRPYPGSIALGDRHGDRIDSFVDSNRNIEQVKGLEENFALLERKRTDYFIQGLYPGLSYLYSFQKESQFKVVHQFNDLLIHYAFSKKSPCVDLVNQVSQKLEAYLYSGKTSSVIEKHKKIWQQKASMAHNSDNKQ